jgi:hypothetical protein
MTRWPRTIRSLPMTAVLLAVSACATGTPPASPLATSFGVNRPPNREPRGSEAFCRVYGEQTAANRVENSRGSRSNSRTGFNIFLARQEGERAYRNCLAGRTN